MDGSSQGSGGFGRLRAASAPVVGMRRPNATAWSNPMPQAVRQARGQGPFALQKIPRTTSTMRPVKRSTSKASRPPAPTRSRAADRAGRSRGNRPASSLRRTSRAAGTRRSPRPCVIAVGRAVGADAVAPLAPGHRREAAGLPVLRLAAPAIPTSTIPTTIAPVETGPGHVAVAPISRPAPPPVPGPLPAGGTIRGRTAALAVPLAIRATLKVRLAALGAAAMLKARLRSRRRAAAVDVRLPALLRRWGALRLGLGLTAAVVALAAVVPTVLRQRRRARPGQQESRQRHADLGLHRLAPGAEGPKVCVRRIRLLLPGA